MAVRKVWPEDRPLTVRLGVVEFDGNDGMTGEAVALLQRMKSEGLDFDDVSIGFNTPDAKIPGRRTSWVTSRCACGATPGGPSRRLV